MKSYTDINQSRKLAEFLPLESADMCWTPFDEKWDAYLGAPHPDAIKKEIPCWSLAALLEIIRNNGRYELQIYEGGYYFESGEFMTESYFNPVDACYEMVIKLHEQKLL